MAHCGTASPNPYTPNLRSTVTILWGRSYGSTLPTRGAADLSKTTSLRSGCAAKSGVRDFKRSETVETGLHKVLEFCEGVWGECVRAENYTDDKNVFLQISPCAGIVFD